MNTMQMIALCLVVLSSGMIVAGAIDRNTKSLDASFYMCAKAAFGEAPKAPWERK